MQQQTKVQIFFPKGTRIENPGGLDNDICGFDCDKVKAYQQKKQEEEKEEEIITTTQKEQEQPPISQTESETHKKNTCPDDEETQNCNKEKTHKKKPMENFIDFLRRFSF